MSTTLKEVIQAAVTQAVADAKLAAHPVGSYYWSSESTDPSTLFGGTWEQVKDRFVLAAGDSYAVGATGGEASHTLSVNEMPSHKHGVGYLSAPGNYLPQGSTSFLSFRNQSSTYDPLINGVLTDISPSGYTTDNFINTEGGGAAHNNMPPYIVAYCWKRTA